MTAAEVLTVAQRDLLVRLARRRGECRGNDAIPAKHLVDRGLARIDSDGDGPYYEITPAGRRFIAFGW